MDNKVMIFLFLTFTQTLARTEKAQWVDPHSLDDNILYKNECNCETTDAPKEIILSHYQRTLNLLLKSLNFNPESSTYKGHISIDLPVDEYNFIKGFSDRVDINNDDWNHLDGILTRVFTKSMSDQFTDVFISWKEILMYNLYCKESLIFSGVFISLVFLYNLLNARIKAGTVFKYLFLFGFIIDFAFTWIRLLQEKEVERMVNSLKYKSLPTECDPNKMGMFQYMFYKFGNEDDKCKEYHRAMLADDLWQVNPFKVFGTQLGDLIQTPANAFGTAFGQFTSAIIANMSWYVAPLLPIIFMFILLMICILLSFLTKTSFGFNFLHLIQFNFGKGDREKVDDMISGKHFRTIMQTLNSRQAIQEIRIIPETKPPVQEKMTVPSIEDVGTDNEDACMNKGHTTGENINVIKKENGKSNEKNTTNRTEKKFDVDRKEKCRKTEVTKEKNETVSTKKFSEKESSEDNQTGLLDESLDHNISF